VRQNVSKNSSGTLKSDWLKTAPIPKLTPKEKEEPGIADFY